MAVARIHADKRWFRWVAGKVEDHPRLARELRRAAERPGKVAEVHGSEVAVLVKRLPDQERIQKMAGEYELAAANDPRSRWTHPLDR